MATRKVILYKRTTSGRLSGVAFITMNPQRPIPSLSHLISSLQHYRAETPEYRYSNHTRDRINSNNLVTQPNPFSFPQADTPAAKHRYLVEFFQRWHHVAYTLEYLNERMTNPLHAVTCEQFEEWLRSTDGSECMDIAVSFNLFGNSLQNLVSWKESLEYEESRNQLPVVSYVTTNSLATRTVSATSSLASLLSSLATSLSTPSPNGKVSKPRTRRKSKASASACAHCLSKSTPEWRRGPDGEKNLCNACGLFYSKLVRKFGAALGAKIFKYRKEHKQVSDRTLPCANDVKHII